MKRMMAAAVAAVGLVLVGYGTAHAGAQVQCGSGGSTGAAPGQQYGTEANVEAKKQMDAEKFQTAEVNSATQACQEVPAPAEGASPERKQ